jgi:DNA-binding MarR family transcriptional regulator
MKLDDNIEDLYAQRLIKAFVQFKRIRLEENENEFSNGEFEKFPLKHSEVMILFAIKETENDYPDGINVSDLSTFVRVKPPSITPAITTLEKSDMILRFTDPTDRRIIRLKLTTKGNALVVKHMDHFVAHIKGLVTYLGPEKSTTLADLMNEVYNFISTNTKQKK